MDRRLCRNSVPVSRDSTVARVSVYPQHDRAVRVWMSEHGLGAGVSVAGLEREEQTANDLLRLQTSSTSPDQCENMGLE